MSQSTFDALDRELAQGGVDALLERLIAELRAEGKYHDLFDALVMRARHTLGLSVVSSPLLEELPEPTRRRLEGDSLEACREVGRLLLAAGKLREAWMYLRPAGEKPQLARVLEETQPNDDNLQEILELALHESVAPARGFELVLQHFGTCNAITTLEGATMNWPRAAQQAATGLLVRHVHSELLGAVRAEITEREGREPRQTTLAQLIEHRDWLLADDNYHVDTSHLAATVRFARLLDERPLLQLAIDLTEYGRRLSPRFQFVGEEPFADLYPAHALFFAALLGQRVDEALAYFHQHVQTQVAEAHDVAAASVYVELLARLGRHAEALEASAALLPPSARRDDFGSSLLELSRRAGSFDRLLALCRDSDDLIGYASALLEAKRGTDSPRSGS